MNESILNSKWVLSVSEDPEVLKHLEEKIRKAAPNCHFEKAITYKDAFDLLVFFMYDLVILDNKLPHSRELLDFAVNRPFPVPVAVVTPFPKASENLKLLKEAGAKVVLPMESDGVVSVSEYIVWYESLTPLARFFENVRKLVNTRSESEHLRGVPDSHFPPRKVKKTFRANIFTGWKQSIEYVKRHINGCFESCPKVINRKWPELRFLGDINARAEVKI